VQRLAKNYDTKNLSIDPHQRKKYEVVNTIPLVRYTKSQAKKINDTDIPEK